jgi:hypothetical protein
MRQEMLMVVSLKLRLQRSKPEYFTKPIIVQLDTCHYRLSPSPISAG